MSRYKLVNEFQLSFNVHETVSRLSYEHAVPEKVSGQKKQLQILFAKSPGNKLCNNPIKKTTVVFSTKILAPGKKFHPQCFVNS